MVFTCTACNTRAVKSFSRHAYEKGVVIVTCPGCQSKHLIADNLGWFGDNTTVEQILEEKGEKVHQMSADDQLDLGMLLGSKKVCINRLDMLRKPVPAKAAHIFHRCELNFFQWLATSDRTSTAGGTKGDSIMQPSSSPQRLQRPVAGMDSRWNWLPNVSLLMSLQIA
jgi:hypothetical protein